MTSALARILSLEIDDYGIFQTPLLCCKTRLGTNNRHHILVRNNVTQSDSLRNVFSRSSPHQSILEAVLQSAMNRITHIFNCRVAADNKRLAKVGVNALSVELVSL
jgi:hypothetical protein